MFYNLDVKNIEFIIKTIKLESELKNRKNS